ncbi:hypothetical protein Leryth_021160 [Lithospermum erythrorhizon]|nr:hypothetical protein Leryth_021160 [Lithospermum erythrorhizon]
MELSKTFKSYIPCPPYLPKHSGRHNHQICLVSMNGCQGYNTTTPVETIETRRLPPVLTHALAIDSLTSAIFDIKCNPPPFASGVIRLEVPVEQKIDAIEWLNSQHNHLLPRCFFGRNQSFDSQTVSNTDHNNVNGNGNCNINSQSSRVKLVSVAGVGAAVFFRHVHPFSLNDWRAIRRFLSKKCPLLHAYGAIRFDSSPYIGSEWEPFGSFYFMIPQVELDELDRSSIIAATVAWDDALFWTYRKAIAALEATMSQISTIILGSQDLFPYTLKGRITHVPNRKSWDTAVSQALQMINKEDSTLTKVVLARRSQIHTTTYINPLIWLARFKVDGGNAYQFFLQPPESPAFIGNTPENLFHRSELKIRSEALAGTRARGRTESLDLQIGYDLLSSYKDHNEFAIVRDCIRRKLEDICSCVSVKPTKALRKLPRVQHLYACLTGTLQSEDDEFRILTSLHPTPAVCGFPMEEAMVLIKKTENFDRGMYAGPIGWFGGGESEFAVGIRSALVDKPGGFSILRATVHSFMLELA